MNISRRAFIKKAALTASLIPLTHLGGCAESGRQIAGRRTLSNRSGVKTSPGWDPVYGPPIQWFSRYGGPGDFEGHRRGGAEPGVDYDVPEGTPLIPSMLSYVSQIDRDWAGSRFILLSSVVAPAFQVSYGHLDKFLVGKEYVVSGEVMAFLGQRVRAVGRGEIVALSGNSGYGPREYRGVQPPHLHYSAYWDDGRNPHSHLDPEKFGPDGGRPIYWDGQTNLDLPPEKRISYLQQTLQSLPEEIGSWPASGEYDEIRGRVAEFHGSMERPIGPKIKDAKSFQDLHGYLKKVILREKRFPPGTGPYRLALKIMSYGTDPRQPVVLTLPFVPPGLEGIFRQSVFSEGPFFRIQAAPENVP